MKAKTSNIKILYFLFPEFKDELEKIELKNDTKEMENYAKSTVLLLLIAINLADKEQTTLHAVDFRRYPIYGRGRIFAAKTLIEERAFELKRKINLHEDLVENSLALFTGFTKEQLQWMEKIYLAVYKRKILLENCPVGTSSYSHNYAFDSKNLANYYDGFSYWNTEKGYSLNKQ